MLCSQDVAYDSERIVLLSLFSLMKQIELIHSRRKLGLIQDGFHKNHHPVITNDRMGHGNSLFNPETGTALTDWSLGTNASIE